MAAPGPGIVPTPFDKYLDEPATGRTPFDAFIRPGEGLPNPEGHVRAATGGVASGLADVLGAPVDLSTWITRQIPGSEWLSRQITGQDPQHQIGGSQSLRHFFGMIPGVAPSEEALAQQLGRPPTASERFANRAAQEVGASLVPAAGLLGAAARAGGAAKPAGNALVRALRDVVDTAQRAPGVTTASELGLAATAGAGAQAAREIAPGSPTAEFAGALAGGVAPAALLHTPTAMVARGAARTMRSMAPEAVQRAATQDVGGAMAEQMTPEATARLRDAETLREEIPGFAPSLGEATGSPSMLAAQRDIEGKATGADLNEHAARREGSIGAVDAFAEERAPLGGNRPLYVVDTARERVAQLGNAIAGEFAKLRGQGGDLAAGLPQVDQAATGRSLRERLRELRRQASAHMNRRADELGINDAEVEVDFAAIADDLGDEFAPRSIFEDRENIPNVVKLIDDIGRQDREAAEAAAVMAVPKGPPPAPTRVVLPDTFPRVPVSTSITRLKRQPGYEMAKRGGGDAEAARIVGGLFNADKVVATLRPSIGADASDVFVVPLGIREAEGGPLNRLPVALANEVAQALGAQVRPTIVQTNATGHTGAVHRPSFTGEVEPGRRYVIADDVATTGSTILGAINFIESRGGKVVGAVTLAAGRGGNILKARPETLAALRARHGDAEEAFRHATGYGFDALSEREAFEYARAGPERLRAIIAERPGAGKAEAGSQQEAPRGARRSSVRVPVVGETENIARGRAAVENVLANQSSVPGSMVRQDVGEITIDWGEAGTPAKDYAELPSLISR